MTTLPISASAVNLRDIRNAATDLCEFAERLREIASWPGIPENVAETFNAVAWWMYMAGNLTQCETPAR